MIYIVKRFRKPCLAMTEDGKPFEYLDSHGRWSPKIDDARVFTNKGHAKNSLRAQAHGGCYPSHRMVHTGDEVYIQPCALSQRGAPEGYTV